MRLTVFGGSLELVLNAPGGPRWGSCGALGGSRWHPDISKLFIWAPLSPHLGPRGALNNPKLLPKRPHGEAEGPTKSHLDTYFDVFSCDLVAKSKKKESKIHRSSLSKRVSALELFLHLLHPLPLPHYHYKSKMKTKTTTRTKTRTKIKTKIETEIKLRLGLRLKLRCRRRF